MRTTAVEAHEDRSFESGTVANGGHLEAGTESLDALYELGLVQEGLHECGVPEGGRVCAIDGNCANKRVTCIHDVLAARTEIERPETDVRPFCVDGRVVVVSDKLACAIDWEFTSSLCAILRIRALQFAMSLDNILSGSFHCVCTCLPTM
jgi:hypothetical protein